MKKVQNSLNSKGSKYHSILSKREANQIKLLKLLSEYLPINTIAKLTNKSSRQIYKSFSVYQKNGLINQDRSLTTEGLQKVQKSYHYIDKGSIKPNDVRLHNLTLKVKIYNQNYIANINKIIQVKNINSQSIDMTNWTAHQIIIDNFKVWLNPKHIIFYMKDYYGKTALDCFYQALEDLNKLTNKVQRLLNLKLFSSKYLDFQISRQHYALVKNQLAEDYNKKSKKLFVYDSRNELRLIIDDSWTLKELEQVHKEHSLNDNQKVQNFFNEIIEKDLLLSGLKEDIEYTQKSLKAVSSNQANASIVLKQINSNIIDLTKSMNHIVKIIGGEK
jgi:hypothetical protein